jgi:hypothetical protein
MMNSGGGKFIIACCMVIAFAGGFFITRTMRLNRQADEKAQKIADAMAEFTGVPPGCRPTDDNWIKLGRDGLRLSLYVEEEPRFPAGIQAVTDACVRNVLIHLRSKGIDPVAQEISIVCGAWFAAPEPDADGVQVRLLGNSKFSPETNQTRFVAPDREQAAQPAGPLGANAPQ